MSDGSDELLWKNKLYFGDNLIGVVLHDGLIE
jgi:hypothetical protein